MEEVDLDSQDDLSDTDGGTAAKVNRGPDGGYYESDDDYAAFEPLVYKDSPPGW